jgi:ubiquinone/menaquinone biosynthesis C-methylase UbiE
MATESNTLWDKFLAPVFRLLIDEAALKAEYDSIDWERESDRFRDAAVDYPDYYRRQNFHGVKGGYLNPDAAMTYDPVTQYVLPPNETWIRQGVGDRIQGSPQRILDLGCGTGSTTVLLKQKFPQAEVVGVDLSPYMLLMANRKAARLGLDLQLCHGNAEHTAFPDASFDVVTASLLFHEMPPEISVRVLQEAFRLLKPGGEVIILDGNQSTLRQTDWLMDIFEEPYIRDYAQGSVDAWMGAAGFDQVRTESHWWSNQISWGLKPIPVTSPQTPSAATAASRDGEAPQWAMG